MSFNILIFILLLFISESFSSPCIANKNFCKKCSPTTHLCIHCEKDSLTPNKEGGCVGLKKCILGKNYCEEFDTENNICTKCNWLLSRL